MGKLRILEPLHGPRSTTRKPDCLASGGEMGALMRSMDWSKTPIGPVESWSPSLQMMVRFLLANRLPLLLWWGPRLCQLYNDQFSVSLGEKHPKSMGQPASECWPEIWSIIGPLIETSFRGGSATWIEDLALELRRHGFNDEAHFTVAHSPVPDDTVPSGIGGVLATIHETTEKIISDRRVAVLRDLGARSAAAKTAEEACTIAAEALARYPKDIPFALLYVIDSPQGVAHLAATSGVDDDSPAAVPVVDLRAPVAAGVWPIQDVVLGQQIILLKDLAARLRTIPPGPWSDPPRSAALIPIRSNTANRLAGVLVAGISPRLRFDEPYRNFFDLLSHQMATALATTRAYEEERKRAELLSEIDRAKTAFFSNVSHEFRTPLTLILGPLEDMLASPDRELTRDQRQQLAVIHRNSLRLLKLVNSVLDFSRIEAGRIEAVFQPADISSVTADLASAFRSAMERAGIRYEINCEPIEEKIFIDRDMWEKIVFNLLSNAFKFTFQGTVSVSVKPVDGSVQLQISDTGVGIPAQELPHLFEWFHRVEGTLGRTYEGTGIGLALVKQLVKLHHGRVSVESTAGVGSTFTVTIPKGRNHSSQVRSGGVRTGASSSIGANSYVEEALRWLPPEPGESQRTLAEHEDAVPSPDVSPATQKQGLEESAGALIVLADDNSDMRDYVRRLLGSQYRIHGVANGFDAVKAARELDADLVLADVMMPGLDGFGVLRAVRADPATRTKPVILLSARAGEESRIKGLQAGADDYLIKPFTARELVARVGTHLKMARIRTESSNVERRLRTEIELERNRLRDSFAQAPAAIALLSGPDHRFAFLNAEYSRVTGRAREQLLGKTVREVFPEVDGQGFYEVLDRVYQRGEPFVAKERKITFNRQGKLISIYMNSAYHPLRDLTGHVEGILIGAVDVTEQVLARTQLEARVKERTAELERAEDSLRALNQSLMQAQDEERRRLALELHDRAGQLLIALKWKLGPLAEEIRQQCPNLSALAQDTLLLADELSNELRTVSHLLHPPVVGEGGLSPALRSYTEGLAERSGLIVNLEIDPNLPRLAPEIETTVFRMVQESLTNIYRHANTKTAAVRLKETLQNIELEIQDMGAGIPGFKSLNDSPLNVGVGVQGMRERVRQVNGRFEFLSGKGGTTVRAVLPKGIGR